MELAVIGGTGIEEFAAFSEGEPETLTTRFGSTDVVRGQVSGAKALFLPRHGLTHQIPPSQIDYRANIAALKAAGIRRVIAVYAVGSLVGELPVGSFAVLGNFIDLTRRRVDTFFDEAVGPAVHTDFSEPYCPEVTSALAGACDERVVRFKPHAVYVGVEGPRYESPAEIRLYSSWGGHIVGMTGLPEAVLAREAGLCCGGLAVVTNCLVGASPTPLSHEQVRTAMLAALTDLWPILERAVQSLPDTSACRCASNSSLTV